MTPKEQIEKEITFLLGRRESPEAKSLVRLLEAKRELYRDALEDVDDPVARGGVQEIKKLLKLLKAEKSELSVDTVE